MNFVVTGASKGIGKAIVERFASESEVHSFAICSRTAHEIASAVTELQQRYPKSRFYGMQCDVSSETDVNVFSSFIAEKIGTPDVVIHNAGFGIFAPLTELRTDEIRSMIATNLRGVFLLTKKLLPALRARKSGTIVAIDSLAGKNGFAGGAGYCASKFALRGFMQCLFLEVRSDNIRCITVCPGSVETDFFADIKNPGTTTTMLQAHDVADSVWAGVRLHERATLSEFDIRPTNPKKA